MYLVRAVLQIKEWLNDPACSSWHFFKKSSTSHRSVFDLKIIPIFHPHYHTHSGNTSRPVNLAIVRWLVSYEDENEYGNDIGNEIEDWPNDKNIVAS